MEVDRRTEGVLGAADAGDVIEMRVGEQDVLHLEPRRRGGPHDVFDLVSRIEHDRLASLLTAEEVPVLVEGRRDVGREKHAIILHMSGPLPVSLSDVFAARRRIGGHLRRTVLVPSAWLTRSRRRSRLAQGRDRSR